MRMTRLPIIAIATAAAFAGALAVIWPSARNAGELLLSQNDPAQLSDARLHSMPLGSGEISKHIEEALAAGDAGLAQSFSEFARTNEISVSESLAAQVDHAAAEQSSASYTARKFATGLITGETDDLASLSGTVTGDLFVFGDIRDVVREGKHLAMGEETDRLVLGLAAGGIAITAGAYISAGGILPARAGLTIVKDARKAGRLGAGLAGWVGRSTRDLIDVPVLQQAVAGASVMRPAASLNAMKAAFRVEKAGSLVRAAKDVGRISERAGVRGALDTLRIAEGPEDLARAARLAESKGGQTRAILKLLGRGALLLTMGAFNLALWVFGALLMLLGLLSSIKAATERATYAWLQRSKARRARRQSVDAQRALPAHVMREVSAGLAVPV